MSFALQLHSYPRPSARFKYTHIYTHIHVYRNVLKPPKVLASAARVILLQSAARSPLRTSQQKRTQCMVHTYTNDFFQVHWGNAKRNQRDFLGCTGKFPDPADPGGHRDVVLLAVGKASNAIRILLMLSAYACFVCTLYEARTTSHCLKFVSQSRHDEVCIIQDQHHNQASSSAPSPSRSTSKTFSVLQTKHSLKKRYNTFKCQRSQ